MSDPLHKTSWVAQQLDCTVEQVAELIRAKKLRAVKMPIKGRDGRYRVPESAFRRYRESLAATDDEPVEPVRATTRAAKRRGRLVGVRDFAD